MARCGEPNVDAGQLSENIDSADLKQQGELGLPSPWAEVLPPLDNPFGPRLSPMFSIWSVVPVSGPDKELLVPQGAPQMSLRYE